MVQVRIGGEELTLTWEELEARAAEGRIPPDALVRAPTVGTDTWTRAADLEWIQALATSRAAAFERARSRAGPPIVTALLLGVQIRVWWLARLPEVKGTLESQWTKWVPPILEDGQVWRVLSMGIVHTDFAHALLNLSWFAYVGYHLELALGGRWLLTLFVSAVAGGTFLSMVGAPDAPSLGASGGLFGLIAAAVVFGFARPELIPDRFRRVFGFALLPYLLLMFVSGILNVGTDNWSHAGGLVVGTVLAFLADPPGFERRPGWSRRVQLGTAGVIVATLLALAALGPRLVSLRPEGLARLLAARKAPTDAARLFAEQQAVGPLRAQVPVGWTPTTDLFGAAGWSSPLSHRTWSVSTEVLDAPGSPEAVLTTWQERLDRSGWPFEIGTPEPATFAGLPGLAVSGTVQAPEPWVFTVRVLVRGQHAWVATWVVEANRADRLAPVRDALFDALVWTPPAELAEARARWEAAPQSLEPRRRLADLEARWGDGDRALSLLRDLVRESPRSKTDWVALLQVAAWYVDSVPDPAALVDDALALDLGSRVDGAAVTLLEAAGLDQEAVGLIELLWARAPGDRILARLRRARGLSEVLRGEPPAAASASWSLGAGRAVALPPTAAPPTVEAARAVALANLEARQALVTAVKGAVAEGSPALVAPLVLLWRGHPLDDPKEVQELALQLDAAADDAPPPWWPADLTDADAVNSAWDALDAAVIAASVPLWPDR